MVTHDFVQVERGKEWQARQGKTKGRPEGGKVRSEGDPGGAKVRQGEAKVRPREARSGKEQKMRFATFIPGGKSGSPAEARAEFLSLRTCK